ncbi:MAG: FtsQ-type POTRA domain-containing protein [Alphaproteobacteria bacterium]|nr:FtsQ-type POTRA domain-containing protein [Alphaproteobacteria bacterium]
MTTAENKIYENVVWPYRLIGNFLLIGAIWLSTFGVITIRHNLIGKQIDSLLSELYQQSAVIGWGLDDITLEGREKTSLNEVFDVLNITRGDNILKIDLPEVRQKVMSLPWVKDAVVTRRYFPNIIHISLKERQVKSIWQYHNEFYPIDEDGEIIETEYVTQPNVLQIVGEDAPQHIKDLLQIIEQDKELFARLKAANYISKRRWDLIFDDVEHGITVKMPEEDLETAWKKLVKLDKTHGLLKYKLTFIDLRLKNKIVVKVADEK